MNFAKLPVVGLPQCFRFGSMIIAGCGLLFTAATLSAAPIGPGGLLFPAPASPLPGGNVVAGGVPQLFNTPTFSGSLTSTVLANDPTNPFGLNDLTFTYLLQNIAGSPGEIDRLTIASFASFLVDAGQVPVAGNVAPTYIDRSLLSNGATMGFSFVQPPLGSGTLQPGQTSDLLVVYTNAQNLAASTANVIDGSVEQVPTFAPIRGVPGVPEPGSIVLAVLAGMGLLAFARRPG
jgi:hypothetical protein